MDYSPIVAQVWGMLIWFIPAALLLAMQTGCRTPPLTTTEPQAQE